MHCQFIITVFTIPSLNTFFYFRVNRYVTLSEGTFMSEGLKKQTTFVSENTAAVVYTPSTPSIWRDLHVKPFVKWAGGKTQLLPTIREAYPEELGLSITKYAEPFVGGGAVLFDILSRYHLERIYISDINAELINTYCVIRDDCESLISSLHEMKVKYIPKSDEERKELFYEYRSRFNHLKKSGENRVELAAHFIFLNKTCFNGLYRVNRKGEFNVPVGSYKNPAILDEENLRNISLLLKGVEIVCGNYRQSLDFIDEQTFVYIDPPYRPLSVTSSFTEYAEGDFNDDSQRKLVEFVRVIDKKGAKFLLSNSDPKNADPKDEFFDELYADFLIQRISASRMINSKGTARGKISEILVSNYLEV